MQTICLKVILQENFVSYEAALKMCDLNTLFSRREKKYLVFGKKCLKHSENKRLFPMNLKLSYSLRQPEEFERTEAYKRSAIPSIQRRLNTHYKYT